MHHFDFEVGDAFFSTFDGSLIDHGDIKVALEFEKKSTMMVLSFSVDGKLKRECDHCGDPLDVPVQFDESLIVKFGIEGEEPSEALAFIPFESHEIDVAPYIYEFIVLNLPLRNVHPAGQCNPRADELLSRMERQPSDEIDPRWGKLKDLSTEN